MSPARYLIGDVLDRMAELPDQSVDLVLTSPPFLALRSYLPADHPQKAKEIGSEPTPAAFLDTLLYLTAEWRRLLAPHGSICVELGDTYSSAGTSKPMTFANPKHVYAETKGRTSDRGGDGWPLDKSLCGIPHLYHLSLAYGRNLLTGEASPAGSWRVRNVVAWCRPNPPVGALGDKFRPGTSYMTVACVSGSRYFDLDAVRGPVSEWTQHYADNDYPGSDKARTEAEKDGPRSGGLAVAGDLAGKRIKAQGAPPLDWWEIPTQPYAGAHYATWPAELCRKPIESMCPRRVCTVCGQPSRRITEPDAEAQAFNRGRREGRATLDLKRGPNESRGDLGAALFKPVANTTLGWSDCGHGAWRNGLVLDPFAGSGTTLAVATGHGRDAIGIDLDPRNAELAYERIGGLFLEIVA